MDRPKRRVNNINHAKEVDCPNMKTNQNLLFYSKNMGGQNKKRWCFEITDSGGESKRRTITLKQKLEVIKRFERNERTCDIVRAMGIKESTLRTIRDSADKIKASFIAGTSLSASKTLRTRPKTIEEMERILNVWIKDQTRKKRGFDIIYPVIKEKALSIYKALKKKSANPSDVPAFSASSGWFAGFKNRHVFPTLSNNNQMDKSPETTLGPMELLLPPSFEADTLEQPDFAAPSDVENVGEMKEEIQEDLTDCVMPPIMVDDNQSADMNHEEVADSVIMDTCQPSSKRLLVVPEHQYSMMSSLASMWKKQKMCDASIGNGTTIIMVHKVVLLAISPTLLSSSEVRNNCFLRVNFPANISENAMRAFAEYMYNGVLDLDPLTLTQLQQISYQLGIEELRLLCETHLCSQTTQASSGSIDNIIFPGTSLPPPQLATQSDSSSIQRKHSSGTEVKKRSSVLNSWPQCSGSQDFVTHGPVVVKTEPQNTVPDYCPVNPMMQTPPARSTTTARPVSKMTHSQGSSSASVTKSSKTSKTFQEPNRTVTVESPLVSRVKLEPVDHSESEYGQHRPTLSSDTSTSNCPPTKTDSSPRATSNCSDSTKPIPGNSSAITTVSNYQPKFSRNQTKAVVATPLLPSPGGKVVPPTRDESNIIALAGNNCFNNSTVRSKSNSTSEPPYPVMLFSSELETLPLNVSKTPTKTEQYVDLTST